MVALASPKERLTLAKARWSRPDVAEALAALDDPDVTTAVYVNRHTSVAVRARIMARAKAVPGGIADCVLDSDSRAMRLPALVVGRSGAGARGGVCRSFTSSTIRHSVHVWRTEGVRRAPRPLHAHRHRDGTPAAPARLRAPRYRALMLAALVRLPGSATASPRPPPARRRGRHPAARPRAVRGTLRRRGPVWPGCAPNSPPW
ncbi:hypothetical protein ACU686_29425 [Yinghuangia aomiensis]